MNNVTLLAFIVWAIDSEYLSIPVIKALEKFQTEASKVQKNYTDPSDVQLFCRACVGQNPIEFFTDYVLFYAKMRVLSGDRNYGIYEEQILSYK